MQSKVGITKQGVRDLNHLGRPAKVPPADQAGDHAESDPVDGSEDQGRQGPDQITPASQLVIGCSEQLPNEPRAYRLMGTSSSGGILLSRHGAIYSAAQGDVSDYGELLGRMLALVLETMPLDRRAKARGALTRRWNQEWGVEAEDLVKTDAGADRDGVDASANGWGLATLPFETSSSIPGPSAMLS